MSRKALARHALLAKLPDNVEKEKDRGPEKKNDT